MDKLHDGTEPHREAVPGDMLAALIRWYVGKGSETDEKIGVMLVHRAKMFERWLACDCLGSYRPPPLLSPAYLSDAETFYLRRLTGEGRPEHLTDCPFYRDQAEFERQQRKLDAKPLAPVDGYFAALKPLGEHLAQQPISDAADNRVRGPSTPRLARLLWQLIDAAETNVIGAIGHRRRPSIRYEYERLRDAARDLWIAPEIPLAAHFYTHPDDFRTQKIYARLRKAAKAWPVNHEPQAFLAAFAPSVTRREIILPEADPIIIASDIVKPAAKKVERGPYLVLVAIGEHAQARGYAPVRAYAQPVQDGRHFSPIHSNAERALQELLMRLQWLLNDKGISTRIKKPVFDLDTELGPCRPDFIVDVLDRRTQRRRLLNLELLGYDAETYCRSKEVTLPRLRLRAPVVEIEVAELADEAALTDRLMLALTGV
ncbi:hypothetical protein Q4F19_08185 [Sphingomonas sp. BIUV-7]|uniref:Uncharacterized protein n=1 Tax=Sphingomonas natans TaxID=3063330 RepID=A0ABT8Y7R3_9SPHN|nr:hypothetical protein [Sphingomonas sp. BIUV-7]